MIGVVETPSPSLGKDTRSVKTIPGLAGRVRIGAPDASLTPASGVVAVAELVCRLSVATALDDAVGEIKQRDRGLSAGQFLVAVAQAQMCGAEFWTGLDRRRADTAGEALSAVATPAATTAVQLADRFGPAQVAGIEEGIGEIACRVVGLLAPARRAVLRAGGATIDLDGTDVEVYGSKKEGIAYNYKGQPAGWPPGTACVVRRVKVRASDISADPRARRRRTIPKTQLALALDGLVEHVYAYSFIATNLDVSTSAKAVEVEAWHRMRTDIEDRIRDAKHGAALRHLPSASRAANTVWMWGALLAVNLSAWLQALAGLDGGDGRGRAHLGTLRHRLLAVPARLIRHAGQSILRLPPGQQLLAQVLSRLRRLPIWT